EIERVDRPGEQHERPDLRGDRAPCDPRRRARDAEPSEPDLEQVEAERVAALLDRDAPDRVQERRREHDREVGRRQAGSIPAVGRAACYPLPRPVMAQAPTLQTVRGYVALTKPRILLLVLFTGLPAMGMAAGGWPAPAFVAATLLGIALPAAAPNTFNCYIERDLDGLIERTRKRPLPSHEISPAPALAFGLTLAL